METTDINECDVELLHVPTVAPENVLGGDMFGLLYNNCAIIARKKSGKTNVIYNVIRKCCDKTTNIVFFVSTIHKCPVYAEILKYCEKKKINVMTFTDIYEGRTNVLEQLIVDLQRPEPPKPPPEEKKEEFVLTRGFGLVPIKTKNVPRQPAKKKLQAPKHFLIFDDISQSLRDPAINRILKIHRNIGCRILISTQNLNDLAPAGIRQLDYALVFRGLSTNLDKLEHLYTNLDLSTNFETFCTMYRQATSAPFSFLYISSRDNTYRINFNKQFVVTDEE